MASINHGNPGNHGLRRRIWMGIAAGLLSLANLAAGGAPIYQGVETKEVGFPGHEVKLAGTLALPKGEAPKPGWPAILIIGEAGNTSREGITIGAATHPIYQELASYLAGKGIASLRYDRRCQGASECQPAKVYDDFIDDAYGAVKFLAKQPGIDPSRIVLFGHGEGGMVATSLLAQHDTAAAGLIVANMSGRTLGKMWRDEFQARMTEEGKSPGEISAYLLKTERVARGMASGRTEFPGEKFDPQNPYDAELLKRIKEFTVSVSLLVNDPLQAFAAVKVPALILQGEKDLQVTIKDAQYLEEALKRIFHPDFTMQSFPEMDHLLKVNKGKPSFASDRETNRPIEAQALAAIDQWMGKRFKTGKQK